MGLNAHLASVKRLDSDDGAFDDDNNRSLRVRMALGAGSDLTSGTLATAWQSSITNANRHAGQVNNADSTDNNFIITGVQLEFGERPTDFEHVPFDVNLLRCQRYLSKMKQNGIRPACPLCPRKWDFRRRSRPRKLAHRSQDDVSLNKLPQIDSHSTGITGRSLKHPEDTIVFLISEVSKPKRSNF